MLKSLVSPLFLREMNSARKRESPLYPPPMPEGYSYKRLRNKQYALMYKREIVGYFHQFSAIDGKVKNHQHEMASKKVFSIRRISTYKVSVFLNGEYIKSFQSEPMAKKYIEEHL